MKYVFSLIINVFDFAFFRLIRQLVCLQVIASFNNFITGDYLSLCMFSKSLCRPTLTPLQQTWRVAN